MTSRTSNACANGVSDEFVARSGRRWSRRAGRRRSIARGRRSDVLARRRRQVRRDSAASGRSAPAHRRPISLASLRPDGNRVARRRVAPSVKLARPQHCLFEGARRLTPTRSRLPARHQLMRDAGSDLGCCRRHRGEHVRRRRPGWRIGVDVERSAPARPPRRVDEGGVVVAEVDGFDVGALDRCAAVQSRRFGRDGVVVEAGDVAARGFRCAEVGADSAAQVGDVCAGARGRCSGRRISSRDGWRQRRWSPARALGR